VNEAKATSAVWVISPQTES